MKSFDFEEILSVLQPRNASNSWVNLGRCLDCLWQCENIACKHFSANVQFIRCTPFVKDFDALGSCALRSNRWRKLFTTIFGLAVIKEATPRRPHPSMERFQPPRPDRHVPVVRDKGANYPEAWAGVVAASPNGGVPKKPA